LAAREASLEDRRERCGDEPQLAHGDEAARARRRGIGVSWSWEVAERDHQIQDPTSAEKIRLLGEYLRLDASSRVLDLACGKAGPAIVLAEAFGCRVQGVELRPEFADEARARVESRGLG